MKTHSYLSTLLLSAVFSFTTISHASGAAALEASHKEYTINIKSVSVASESSRIEETSLFNIKLNNGDAAQQQALEKIINTLKRFLKDPILYLERNEQEQLKPVVDQKEPRAPKLPPMREINDVNSAPEAAASADDDDPASEAAASADDDDPASEAAESATDDDETTHGTEIQQLKDRALKALRAIGVTDHEIVTNIYSRYASRHVDQLNGKKNKRDTVNKLVAFAKERGVM